MHDALGPVTTVEELLLHAHWLRRLAGVLELDPLDEPEVALARVCMLEVQLAPPTRDFGPFPAIVLVADERPFVDSDAPRNAFALEPDAIQAELGAATCDWSFLGDGAGRRFRAWFEADAGGRALISALRPEVAVVVEARVEGGPVLARRELVTSAGRHRIVLAYGESRQGD